MLDGEGDSIREPGRGLIRWVSKLEEGVDARTRVVRTTGFVQEASARGDESSAGLRRSKNHQFCHLEQWSKEAYGRLI